MSDELAFLDATAQADLVQRRKVSPVELVDAAIARIERLDRELNAVIIPLFEKARAQAASPALPNGFFRGVPFLLKDIICHSAGDPYHAGMKLLRKLRWIEHEDTHLAAKFRAAGLVFLGRTNVPELGSQPTTEPEAYGPTRNPWDTGRSTGGSSGGARRPGGGPTLHARGRRVDRAGPRLLEREDGAPARSRRRRAHELGGRRAGSGVQRAPVHPRRRVAAVALAADRFVVGGGVRPPAHADARRAAPAPRRVLREAGRSPPRLPARPALRDVHLTVQHQRAARVLAATLLERRWTPDRRPARGRVRARGPADPRRYPARGGAAVGGPPACGARLKRHSIGTLPSGATNRAHQDDAGEQAFLATHRSLDHEPATMGLSAASWRRPPLSRSSRASPVATPLPGSRGRASWRPDRRRCRPRSPARRSPPRARPRSPGTPRSVSR